MNLAFVFSCLTSNSYVDTPEIKKDSTLINAFLSFLFFSKLVENFTVFVVAESCSVAESSLVRAKAPFPGSTLFFCNSLFFFLLCILIKEIIIVEIFMRLTMSRKITNDFINISESSNFDSVLGLQIYMLIMNKIDMQREIWMNLHMRTDECNGYPLELGLIFCVMERDEVPIFCHKWEKDREILLFNGELDLFERRKVMDKFEEHQRYFLLQLQLVLKILV